MLNIFLKLTRRFLKSLKRLSRRPSFSLNPRIFKWFKPKKVKQQKVKPEKSSKQRERKIKPRKIYDVSWIIEQRAWRTNNRALAKYKAPLKLTQAQKAKWERIAKNQRSTLQKALINRDRGRKLGKRQNEALDYFTLIEFSSRLDEKSNNRYWYFKLKSSFLKYGVYDTWTKMCYLYMKNKAHRTYTFFNVPQTKMRVLIAADSAGTYMWDYFGNHYSINKRHWIRGKHR